MGAAVMMTNAQIEDLIANSFNFPSERNRILELRDEGAVVVLNGLQRVDIIH
jgi:hypothetical protein